MRACVIAFIFSLGFAANAATSPVEAQINRIADASHLEFLGRKQWPYAIEKKVEGNAAFVVLLVPPLSEESKTKLESYSDPRIEKVEVHLGSVDGQTEIRFQLKQKHVDFFDYLTEEPPRLIVDFFEAESEASQPQVAEKTPPTKPAPQKPTAKATAATPVKTDPSEASSTQVQRAPAGSELLRVETAMTDVPTEETSEAVEDSELVSMEGQDPEYRRFTLPPERIQQSALIASRGNIYLHFPAIEFRTNLLSQLEETPPKYIIDPQETEENKQARLILNLFEKEQIASALKVADIFLKKYPESAYDEIVRYVMADSYHQIWKKEQNASSFDKAMTLYRTLVEEYPESPVTNRTLLFIGYSYLSRGDSFGAIRTFERFLSAHPETTYSDQVRMAIAQAHLDLNHPSDAIELLNRVEEKGVQKRDRIEAAYLRGNVYFRSGDRARAVEEYEQAMSKYPEGIGLFPNALFNQGEALFWLARYPESMESLRKFLVRFSNHEHAGYAITRLGEMLEMMGAPEEQILGAYRESHFRYRNTGGAAVARARLLSRRFKSMKERELEEAIKEMRALESQIDRPGADEFIHFVISDGLHERGDFNRATDVLVSFYQSNPNLHNKERFQERIERNITSGIQRHVENGEFFHALKTYGKYANTWLKTGDRIDTEYYVGRAYEQAGVFKQARNIYNKTYKRLEELRNSQNAEVRSVFESLPSRESTLLRLAATHYQENDYAKASETLARIQDESHLQARERVEKMELAANLSIQRGDHKTAIRLYQNLLEAWDDKPDLVAGAQLKLAHLLAESGSPTQAITTLENLLSVWSEREAPDAERLYETLDTLGNLYVQQKQIEKALTPYSRLLDEFEGQRDVSAHRYKLGSLYFELGKMKEAKDIWAPLNNAGGFWARLAQDRLKESQWHSEYDKYIERIPAMSDRKKETLNQ